MKYPTVILLLASLNYNLWVQVDGAKILAIFPFPGPSQYILVQPYLKALAAKGHDVSVVSTFPHKEKIANFTDIPVLEVFEGYEEDVIKYSHITTKWGQYSFFTDFITRVSRIVLENHTIKNWMKTDKKFDLLIIETLQMHALYGLAQHFDAKLIGITSFGTDPHNDDLVGNTSPPSYLPLVSENLPDKMDFWLRLENLYYISLNWMHRRIEHFPKQEKLYKEFFPQAKIDMYELRKTFSLLLLNQHFSLGLPRPYVPNMIEVGGFHVNHIPKPLPADMEAFINSSKHGVIYFSMGSNIKSKDLPADTLEKLMKTFASLKEKVLWKFENPDLPGKPDNVFISKWFPQGDILAHSNVKLFFSHGGLLSTTESIYHGKPMLGMPVWYDQYSNVERARVAGYALVVDINNLTEKDLKAKILELLNNKKYADIAAKMSSRFKDRQMSPMDTAIYWTEYVLRHDGASFMRVAAQDLNLIQYHNLDVIALVVVGFVFVALTIIVALRKLLSLLVADKNKKFSDKKKQKKH